MTIRHATIDDIPIMSRVMARSWRAAFPGQLPQDFLDTLQDNYFEPRFHERRTECRYLIAEENGDAIGVLAHNKAYADDSADGEIWLCYVIPEYWSQGIGHQLLSAAKNNLRNMGYTRAYLYVLDTNERARRAYIRAGFVRCPENAVKHHDFHGAKLTDERFVVTL